MINHKTLDDITRKISEMLPDSVGTATEDLRNNIRAILESSLNKMNLVTREEFDVQSELLARTQERIRQLEQQLDALEKKSG